MNKAERQRERGAMNEFERARDTYAKNRRQNEKYLPHLYGLPPRTVEVAPAPTPPVSIEISKEKMSTDAVFQIKVTLPDREINMTITKPNIYANIPKARVTEAEIRKALSQGLIAMLGAVK